MFPLSREFILSGWTIQRPIKTRLYLLMAQDKAICYCNLCLKAEELFRTVSII